MDNLARGVASSAQEAAPAGGVEAGWPDLFSRDPAYIQRRRPCSAASSDSGSGCVDERDTSPSARSDFLERVRRGDFATRGQWVPTAATARADSEPTHGGAVASSDAAAGSAHRYLVAADTQDYP